MGEVLDFPRDVDRYKYFVRGSNQHQAKLELRTFRWLVERYTNPGDTILDPMSGIGTVHYAATMGRNTIAIEIAPKFVTLQWENVQMLQETLGIPEGVDIQVLEGDCRRFLPLQTSPTAVIFSPPYGSLWKASAAPKSQFAEAKHINIGYDLQDANVGNISTYPLYLTAMKEIYKLCNRSLAMGSILVSVTKDYVKAGERVHVSKDNVAQLMQAGFQLEEWHWRYTDPKIFQITARQRRADKGINKPELDIDYEDLLVFRKIAELA
jgi:tRNA G10  N-methylase Trm11